MELIGGLVVNHQLVADGAQREPGGVCPVSLDRAMLVGTGEVAALPRDELHLTTGSDDEHVTGVRGDCPGTFDLEQRVGLSGERPDGLGVHHPNLARAKFGHHHGGRPIAHVEVGSKRP